MADNREYKFYGWQGADVLPADPIYAKAGTPKDLYDLLDGIWCKETCAPRLQDEWSEENKTLGQCSITAFLVQDIYGGEVYGILRPAGNYHCYNVVDGHVFDLTSEQFGDEASSLSYEGNPIQDRKVHFAKTEKRLRYENLRCKVQEQLGIFRRMRRFNQQISYDNCYEVLKNAPRGILGLQGENGYPHSIPMDHWFDPVEGKLYFHGAKEGLKIDLIGKNNKASYVVMDEGFRKDGDWALNINSVLCLGKINIVTDEDIRLKAFMNLGLKFYPTKESVEDEIRKAASRAFILEFNIDRMNGKLVNES